MKTVALIIGIAVAVSLTAFTCYEDQQGVIQYETRINVHRNLPPDREDMKNVLPEFRIIKYQLFFTADQSLYRPVEADEDDDSGPRQRFRRPNIEIFVDRANSKQVTQQDFMGKKYIIHDSLSISPWKFGTETIDIMGYTCRQAYFTEQRRGRSQEVTAWYTDQLRPFLGPENYNTLPGAVLAVDINNGERVIVAKGIEFREMKKNELKEPTAGSPVSRHEFDTLMAEQIERMRASGRVFIQN